MKPGHNKFGVRIDRAGVERRTVDGIKFDSLKESRRYQDLKLLVRVGQITGLEWEKKALTYELAVNGQLICKYVADFRYIEGGKTVVEDAKGFRTPDYRIKRKLMLACHGIEVKEV